MKAITLLYIINATLLLLHEIESAYEKEWELLNLPGHVSGFLLLHLPIILFIFYGLVEIQKGTFPGMIAGMVLGVGGGIPLVVHKWVIKTPGQFNRPISNGIIYLNVLSGVCLLVVSVQALA